MKEAKELTHAIKDLMEKADPLPPTKSQIGNKVMAPVSFIGEVMVVTGFGLTFFARKAGHSIDSKIDAAEKKEKVPAVS